MTAAKEQRFRDDSSEADTPRHGPRVGQAAGRPDNRPREKTPLRPIERREGDGYRPAGQKGLSAATTICSSWGN
jgi:hypothetical protein